MPILALCFDLDDTLWPVLPVLQQAEQRGAARILAAHPQAAGTATDPQTLISRMRAWREQVGNEHPERAFDLTWLRHEALRRQADAAGYGTQEALDFADEVFAVFIEARHEVEPYADVPMALERLARHFPLHVLSNGNAEPARTPLGRHFRAAHSARSLGLAKPDPRAFQRVADDAGIPVAHWLHIGDDPHADIHGGRAAGMRTAWIHRHEKHWPAELPRADHEFADLAALADHLLRPE
ncbi:MAG: hypothetical protein RL026_2839 [Pseudomonadota bacterium]